MLADLLHILVIWANIEGSIAQTHPACFKKGCQLAQRLVWAASNAQKRDCLNGNQLPPALAVVKEQPIQELLGLPPGLRLILACGFWVLAVFILWVWLGWASGFRVLEFLAASQPRGTILRAKAMARLRGSASEWVGLSDRGNAFIWRQLLSARSP